MSNLSEFGKWLSHPQPGEEVVITGISGRFPESRNVQEYKENLFNKIDMVTDDDRRWKLQKLEIPQRSGKICDVDKFDAGYFGLHYRQADIMTPMMRKILEIAVEAIMDAGLNPSELEGSKTGVFVGLCYSDMEIETLSNITEPQNFGITGFLRSLVAHRVSYFLKLKGPSYSVDTACSSSFNALELAFKAIRSGQCENALVAGVNLVLQPGISRQYFRLGMLSSDGTCKIFDQTADGLVRGESTACVFLQKAKNSRRIYAKIIHTKINSDGFKTAGITFPSSQMQEALMAESLEESEINSSDISFMEAHSTGTKVGDVQECQAIDCAIAKKRNKTLLMGSVKCSVGHTEAASGLCSLIKMIIAMETGYIAPNINLKNIKKEIVGLMEKRMKVVTELTELEGENAVVAVNNFGFGGTNCHLLVQRFDKLKKNESLLEDDVPRLVCISGRTAEAAEKLLQNINERQLDTEYVGLLHQVFGKDIPGHFYRGFTIISKTGPIKTEVGRISTKKKKPLQVILGDFEKDYFLFSQRLMEYPGCTDTMKRINKFMHKINLFDIINGHHKNMRWKPFAIFSVQLGLIEFLKSLELEFGVVSNNTLGKLVIAYHNGDITLEDAFEAISNSVDKTAEKAATIKSAQEVERIRNFLSSDNKINPLFNQNILTKSKGCTVLNFSDETLHKNNDIFRGICDNTTLLNLIGRLYLEGYNPQIHKLYRPVEYPVSRTTPIISDMIEWNHRKVWNIPRNDVFTGSYISQKEHTIDLDLYEEQRYISGHVIDGRNLFPAMEYLQLVWKTFIQNYNMSEVDSLPIVFENCRFIRAVAVTKKEPLKILVSIQRESGNFEIVEKGALLVTGRVYSPLDIKKHQSDLFLYHLDENRSNYLEKDEIYRELNLRGYNYSGLFKGIVKCSVDTTAALIQWENNWTTFMDKMLQLKILQMDTRSLYVPVSIEKLSINIIEHVIFANRVADSLCPVYSYKNCNVIRSGGIEICGLQAASINRKKSPSIPVLEKHVFVPNNIEITLKQSLRVLVQIILENSLENNFKAVEIVNEVRNTDSIYLTPIIFEALNDVPSVIVDLTIFSKSKVDTIPEIKVEDFALTHTSNLLLIVATNIFKFPDLLDEAVAALNGNGFLLSREDIEFVPENIENIVVLNEHIVGDEKLILMRKTNKVENVDLVEVLPGNFHWMSQLQSARKENANVVIYSQNQNPEGILGFTNCIRREPKGQKVRCFLMMDQAPRFDLKNVFYKNQMNKQMAVNIYKENKWGTYRHLLLDDVQEVEGQHFFVNNTVKGDLSSLKWVEGPLTVETKPSKDSMLVFPVYSALNFKDVVLASGRVSIDSFSNNRSIQECPLGFEFCGYDTNGRRVMGMIINGAISTVVNADLNFLCQVPDEWTLEDGSTIICVYATVLYALLKVIKIKPGMSILIHSATGGVGLAALNVCIHHGCEIFVTVGTQEKRDYLKKHFPQILESHIGNSRNLSFEEMIQSKTKGRGVDIVLNSLSEEKLKASIRCMAPGGNFLEIGKFDIGNNVSLSLLLLEKKVNYHGIMLDRITTGSPEIKTWIINKIEEGIKLGYVKPLPRTVFQRNQIEESFRFMMTGQHMGKVIIQMRPENKTVLFSERVFKGYPRFSCNPEKSYIILGGLGGIGLELADWLYVRGAKKLLLVSRQGIQSGYQKQRIRNWESSGIIVQISTENITTKKGCLNLIRKADTLGSVDGIFNLAVVLKDGFFEEQTEETFNVSLAPKAQATIYLDEITRQLCPELRYFVVFSSVSCGRGNASQTNYGMANSIMERICERRKHDGLPGLAIQWGAIGDVGLVAKMQKEGKELVIGGTLQQRVSSCLEVLDTVLRQDHPVVSSMVVAEKTRKSTSSAVDAVAYILGIKDIKAVKFDITFAELGMDSMMGTETIQILEKDFDIYLTAKEVRDMSFATLMKLETEQKTLEGRTEKIEKDTNIILKSIPRDAADDVPIVKLSAKSKIHESGTTIFVLPGIEGVFEELLPIVNNLKAEVFGIQYGHCWSKNCMEEYVEAIFPHIKKAASKQGAFCIIGYSFGTAVATELVSLLEKKGFTGVLIQIEGSPTYVSAGLRQNFPQDKQEELEALLLSRIVSFLLPTSHSLELKDKILSCTNFDERIQFALSQIPSEAIKKHKFIKQAIIGVYNRIKAATNYKFSKEKIKSRVHLFKARFPIVADFADDYQLSEICQEPIQVTLLDGNHATILSQDRLINRVAEIVNDQK